MQDLSTLFVDIETTSIDPRNGRICQIAMILPDGTEFESLVNPLIPIPASATELHGITDEMVQTAPTFKELAPVIIQAFESVECFVAYNFSFDFGFIQHELERAVSYELSEDDFVFIDPYRIFKRMFPHKLANAYVFYLGKEMEREHSAMIDIRSTKEVLEKQKEFYPALFMKTAEEIQMETIGEIGILGKWFNKTNGQVSFRQGKFKDQIIDLKAHADYLKRISGLDDITLSERRYVKKVLAG